MSNPFFTALAAAFLFGAATPFSKILLAALPPLQLAGLLYLGAAAGVLVLLLARRDTLGLGAGMGRRNAARLGAAVFCGGICGPVFLLKGLQLAPAGSVSLWLVLEMVWTALLGHLFFKDQLGRWGWAGAAGCLAGSVLLSLDGGIAGCRAGAWVTLACLAWGLDNHMTALIDGLKPLQSTFWKGLVAGTITLAAGCLQTGFHPSGSALVFGLLLGALSYGASIALYIRSAQALGATRSQLAFSSAPFFGLLLAFLFLREWPTWAEGSAAAVFIASIALVFRDRHSHAHEHAATEHIHSHRHDDGHHQHVHADGASPRSHSHLHVHEPMRHAHPHWPDLHHRHPHTG